MTKKDSRNLFLVTGGSGEIGAALCQILATKNYKPLIGYTSNHSAADRIATKVGGEAVALNLLDFKQIDKLISGIVDSGQILSGVILGASPSLNIKPFGQIEAQDMETQWKINVLGHQYLLAGLVRSLFRKRKKGIVIGILSEAMGTPEQAAMGSMGAYIIAKYGLQGLLSVLKKEYKWLDVQTRSPGFTRTRMLNDAFDERFIESLTLAKQMKTPEESASEILDHVNLENNG